MKRPYHELYINGAFQKGGAGVGISENPATGEIWAEFAMASKDDVEAAIESAEAALNNPEWRDMTQTARGKLLFRLADLIEENAEALGRLETQDSGKLLAETVVQTRYVADYYRYFGGLADKIEGAVLPIDKPNMHVFTQLEPIGIVAAIVPWNAQMFLTATKLGPALAAGCAVILKASEIAPIAMLEFAKLIDQAGFPKGAVNVITGDAKNCAIPLTSLPKIDRIAFTGGPEAARHVVRNSASNFAVTSLELGGKSPIIVFDDADLENAANGLIAGNFGASGQSCVAGSRAIVSRGCANQLTEIIKQKMEAVKIGDPLDASTNMGPLCTKTQIENIQNVINLSLEQGAYVEFGGTPLERAGNFMQPTLIRANSKETASLHNELFGPVMTMLTFESEDEAIRLANDSVYGLGAGLFTRDLARAHRVSRRIKSGICWINTYRAISPIAPFGGYNQSGYGREAGLHSVQDYMRSKTVWINMSDEPMPNPFLMR